MITPANLAYPSRYIDDLYTSVRNNTSGATEYTSKNLCTVCADNELKSDRNYSLICTEVHGRLVVGLMLEVSA